MNTIDPNTAWLPYSPSPAAPWNLQRAGHLYRRAAFGATWSQLQQALADGPQKTIDALLAGGADQDGFARQMAQTAQSLGANDENQLRAWWLYRLLHTPHPLQEKLTLFWHNHFATSNAKVRNTVAMREQNELLRRHALGKFDALLQGISKDPAMLVWLDTNLNKKGNANENYARELMELFSLGIGNYTERDVREAARAFTGWEVRDGKYRLNSSQHDAGEKQFRGRSGRFGGEEVVQMCLEQDACPRFIVTKLFRFLVSETIEPTPELIEPLARQYRESGFDTGKLVAMVLRSNLFFSAAAYRSQIKSPVDFAVGIVRALDGRVGTLPLADALEGLGQRLFAPPSVKGWDGGTSWVNANMLLLRHNLALAITSTQDDRFGRRTDPAKIARQHNRQSAEELMAFFSQLFLQDDLPQATREKLVEYLRDAKGQSYPVYWTADDRENQRIRAACHLLLTQPEFQLN